ncbi:MAG: hypothetical protein L0Z62_01645 [Gemmataceae bacterium]|nr:hypothetical protein [Gemmataceae bacterium]
MPVRTLLTPLRRYLAPHMGRLRQTFDGLGGRLREAVAGAASQAVAAALGEATAPEIRRLAG